MAGDKDDGDDEVQSRVRSIFGDDYDSLTDDERENAGVYTKSNKKWSADDIREMSTTPSGRLLKKGEKTRKQRMLYDKSNKDA